MDSGECPNREDKREHSSAEGSGSFELLFFNKKEFMPLGNWQIKKVWEGKLGWLQKSQFDISADDVISSM